MAYHVACLAKLSHFMLINQRVFQFFLIFQFFLPHFLRMQAFQMYNISLEVHHKKV